MKVYSKNKENIFEGNSTKIFKLVDTLQDQVEDLVARIGKYDNETNIKSIDSIVSTLEELKNTLR